MSVWVKTGSFPVPASGSSVIDVTSHGTNPKAIHVWFTWANSNDVNRAGALFAHGFSDGINHRAWMANRESNATINTQRNNSITNMLHGQDFANVLDVSATAAMNVNDVTLTYSNQAETLILHYVIFGGSDVTAVVREMAASSSPHTGVGFTSDLILFGCSGNAFTNASVHGFQSFGVARDNGVSIDQWCLFSYFGDDDLDTLGSGLNAVDFVGQYADGDFTAWQAQITVIGTDGFTWTGSNADEFVALCLNFGGVAAVDVGTFTKATGAAPVTQQMPDVGFTPQQYFLGSAFNTAVDLTTNRDCRLAFGAYDEVTGAGHSAIATGDNVTGTDAHSRSHNSEVLQISQNLNANGVQSSATPDAITDQTPSFEWNPNTADAFHIGYYAIEEGTPADFPIDVDPGSFVFTGVAAGIVADYEFNADPGSFALAGVEIAQEVDFPTAPGSFVIGGVVAVVEGPTIASVDDNDIDDAETGIGVVCTDAEAAQGTGKFEISDNAVYGSGTVVAQTITGWTDTLVTITAVLGALAPGVTRYGWLTNDTGTRNVDGFVLRLRRAQAVVIPLSVNIAVSGEDTTHQLTPPAGKSGADFIAGRIQDDENPADTIDPDADEFTELEWALKFLPAARDVEYSVRISISGVPLDIYDQIATIDVPAAGGPTDFPLNCDPGSFTITGAVEVNEIGYPAAPDSFAITGTAAAVVADYLIDVLPDAFTITGTAAAIVADYFDDALPGNFALNGAAISLDIGYNADPGSLVLTGFLVELITDYIINCDPTSLAINGVATGLITDYDLEADPGAFAINGAAVDMLVTVVFIVESESFVISGAVALLLTDYIFEAEPGTFAIGGVAAAPDLGIPVDTGVIAITGVATALKIDYVLEADPDSYAINGVAADLIADYEIDADPGTFAIGGIAVSLDLSFEADSGSFAVNGVAADVVGGFVDTVDPGSFAINGVLADLLTDYDLEADPGSFALNGVEISLDIGYNADPGSFVVTGVTVDLLTDYNLEADPGSCVVTGIAVEFTFDADLSVNVDPGSFVVSGIAADVVADIFEDVDSDSIVITGFSADLIVDYELLADPGSFVLTGVLAELDVDYDLEADPGSFAVAGFLTDLLKDFFFDADPGSIDLTGVEISLEFGLDADPGSFAVTGAAADLEPDYVVLSDPATFAVNGVAADILADRVLDADPESYAVTGVAADLFTEFVTSADPGTFVLTGFVIDLISDYLENVVPGAYTITGIEAIFTEDVLPEIIEIEDVSITSPTVISVSITIPMVSGVVLTVAAVILVVIVSPTIILVTLTLPDSTGIRLRPE